MTDVTPKIREWLQKTGYPLELRVGRRFQAAGWHVNYSRWFRDIRTRKARALDVQAIVGAVKPQEASFFFSLCVECKTSTHPWIAFGSGTQLGRDGMLSFMMGDLTRMCLISAKSESVAIPELVPATTPRVGGVVQAILGSKGESSPSAYRALLEARSSALAFDRDYRALSIEVFPGLASVSVFIPLVVVSGQLFEYTVADDLSEKLREVDAVVASVPGLGENEDALMPVVTERYAESLGEEFQRQAHGFCIAMLHNASRIAGALRIEEGKLADPAGVQRKERQ